MPTENADEIQVHSSKLTVIASWCRLFIPYLSQFSIMQIKNTCVINEMAQYVCMFACLSAFIIETMSWKSLFSWNRFENHKFHPLLYRREHYVICAIRKHISTALSKIHQDLIFLSSTKFTFTSYYSSKTGRCDHYQAYTF